MRLNLKFSELSVVSDGSLFVIKKINEVILMRKFFQKKRTRKKQKPKQKIEFSKLIMVGVMLTYFIALIFIMAVIWKLIGINSTSIGTVISAFCTFVGAPISVAIGFYSWKAKNENTVKLSNITGQVISPTINYSNDNMPIHENDGI